MDVDPTIPKWDSFVLVRNKGVHIRGTVHITILTLKAPAIAGAFYFFIRSNNRP